MSSRPPTSTPADDLLGRAFEALRRARKRAEDVARATDTCLIEAVDGKPVRVSPPPRTQTTGGRGSERPAAK